jgi:peptide/nickel transport system permease protein
VAAVDASAAVPVLPGRAAERGYWGEAWLHLRRDRAAMFGLVTVALLLICAIFAPLIAPHDPLYQNSYGLTANGSPLDPNGTFLLGTDPLGRDELSRLLYGARVSLAVGVGANLVAAAIGILFGGLAGLIGGAVEIVLMRTVDVLLGFPLLLLAIVFLAVTPPGILTIMLIVGISFGAYLARVVYAQVISLREREFVLAARTGGVGTPAILARHIVPHILPSVLVFCTLGVATAVLLEAALSYVGIGIKPPTPSWGNMISDGQTYLFVKPLLVALPCGTIVLAMIGFSLLGDGLRDALDPTLERRARMIAGIR